MDGKDFFFLEEKKGRKQGIEKRQDSIDQNLVRIKFKKWRYGKLR